MSPTTGDMIAKVVMVWIMAVALGGVVWLAVTWDKWFWLLVPPALGCFCMWLLL